MFAGLAARTSIIYMTGITYCILFLLCSIRNGVVGQQKGYLFAVTLQLWSGKRDHFFKCSPLFLQSS